MKPPLQIPVTFGHWLVQGDLLECRLPRKTVTVRAPAKLLRAVLRLCDGSLDRADVLARLGRQWSASDVNAFMQQLEQEQVLVEASEVWAHWSASAHRPAPVTAVSPRSQAQPGQGSWHPSLASGQSPIAAILAKCESSTTFDDQPVGAEALCSVLWAAHLSADTLHSMRWLVAVLRELPARHAPRDSQHAALSAGVYEARLHTAGGATLRPLPGIAQDAWRCLRDPRILQFASALILPVQDLSIAGREHGAHAGLIATFETGRCLQNAQLMATELGAGWAVRIDVVAQSVLNLFGLGEPLSTRHLVMPALVLGASPSAAQEAQQATDRWLEISPNLLPRAAPDTEQPSGFAFAATPVAAEYRALFRASGRADDPGLAITKAEAEAWERRAWASPHGLIEARQGELASVIEPQELVGYTQRQYSRAQFPFKPFSTRRRHLWKQAVDVASGEPSFVLAECVHALSSLPDAYQAKAYTSTSTSGMAAGVTLDDALGRAALEVIERDAFLCAWLSGRGPAAILPSSLPTAVARRFAALSSSGVRVVAMDLSADLAPVVGVFAQAHGLPFTAVMAAADFSPEQALLRALEEVEGRTAHAQRFAAPAPDSGNALSDIERYYRSPRTYRHADFLAASSTSVSFRTVGRHAAKNWPELQSRLLAGGHRLVVADMTPEGAATRQGRTPLHVVRALVPGMLPIWFSRGMQPAGMPRFIQSVGAAGARRADLHIHPFT